MVPLDYCRMVPQYIYPTITKEQWYICRLGWCMTRRRTCRWWCLWFCPLVILHCRSRGIGECHQRLGTMYFANVKVTSGSCGTVSQSLNWWIVRQFSWCFVHVLSSSILSVIGDTLIQVKGQLHNFSPKTWPWDIRPITFHRIICSCSVYTAAPLKFLLKYNMHDVDGMWGGSICTNTAK